MKYIVYVLISEVTKKSYVGFTNNLTKRLQEHNKGKNYFTSRYKPWKIIHMEEFVTYSEARKREKYLKSASGRRIVLKKVFAGS